MVTQGRRFVTIAMAIAAVVFLSWTARADDGANAGKRKGKQARAQKAEQPRTAKGQKAGNARGAKQGKGNRTTRQLPEGAPVKNDTTTAPAQPVATTDLTGVVREDARDEQGNVTSVKLAVGDKVYKVTGDHAAELLGMVGKTVKVTGTVGKNAADEDTVTVATVGEVPAPAATEPAAPPPAEQPAK